MSNYRGLPAFRLVGHGVYGGAYRWASPYADTWPAIADSYSPFYEDPQTKYGVCDCAGGALRRNNCNYQQGGYMPQCLAQGKNCRCINSASTDWGCFNKQGANCL